MRLKGKTLVFLSAILMILSGSIGFFSIYELNNIGEKLVGEQALAIVKTFSYQIDGDKFESIATKKENANEYVLKMNNLMDQVKKETGCTYIYAFAKESDKEYKYIISNDGEVGEVEDISTYDTVFQDAMNNGEGGYTPVQNDSQYGKMLSAVVAIKNSS